MNYKIKDLSQLMSVSSNTIRRYEKLGYLQPVRNATSHYRFYTNADISKTMFVRFLRKMGFTHPDILTILSTNIDSSVLLCQNYLAKMDDQIATLTKSRHLLKDYIKLMESQVESQELVRTRLSVPLYYTMFCSNDQIYNEPERLQVIQQYMYHAPETHMIYLFKKEDILQNIPYYQSGWAIKPKDMVQLHLENNPYTHLYPETQVLICQGELPVNIDTYLKNDMTKYSTTMLKEAFDYMNDNNYKLSGDVIGIRVSLATHNGHAVQYILFNVPIEKADGMQ